MKMYEYGKPSKPHILLIHGMWMSHEMLLPYMDGFLEEYHILAPDLTGHGSDHIVCRKDIKKFYPYATITVRKGYGHCTYLFEHRREYPAILRSYMRRSGEYEVTEGA